jgi:hypothetical protein
MSDRPLTIISFNVKGLGKDSIKQKFIKTWLASLPNPPQVLFIQEHHLDNPGVTSSTKGLEFWQGKKPSGTPEFQWEPPNAPVPGPPFWWIE